MWLATLQEEPADELGRGEPHRALGVAPINRPATRHVILVEADQPEAADLGAEVVRVGRDGAQGVGGGVERVTRSNGLWTASSVSRVTWR